MLTTTYLLFGLGCLGALDILLFHSIAHGIRSHHDSVAELITHSFRGPTYAALFLLIPNFELHGLFAWGLNAILIFDVAVSVFDFFLENHSRRLLGGLPSGEYVLHMFMAMVFGALFASFIFLNHAWFALPTLLLYTPGSVPLILRIVLGLMAIGVLISGLQDALAAYRLRKSSPQVAFTKTQDTKAAIHETSSGNRSWMRATLLAAGAYNLLWGMWVLMFPNYIFNLTSMPLPNYPQIWQCVGMIVSVYGIGYIVAAHNPIQHWPIVLVGLLGKFFGPIGMACSIAKHSLPPAFAGICVTNDLIWWVPFGLILIASRNEHLRSSNQATAKPSSAVEATSYPCKAM